MVVRSTVLEVRATVLRFVHQMIDADTEHTSATTVLVAAHTDSQLRKASALPRGRRQARALSQRALPWRHRHGRFAFPPALTDTAPSTSRARCSTASTATTGCSARPAREAKQRFEAADWHGQQRAQAQRIEFYDHRVDEAAERLQSEFDIGIASMDTWQQVKLHYIGLLADHHQPELAETFFNSVTTKLLHRSYFRNDFIFVRPAVCTEYIENDEPASLPTYRAYYPTRETLHDTLAAHREQLPAAARVRGPGPRRRPGAGAPCAVDARPDRRCAPNFQIQVLSSLFFRNKGAYLVGKVINGFNEMPFALPILHNAHGKLVIDTALFGEDDLLMLFSFARAYFMVDMEIPAPTCSSCAR